MSLKKRELLLVDGYNIIGAWPHLRKLRDIDFDQARNDLIEAMAEYQAATGRIVTVVFDAHMRYGRESIQKRSRVEVVYTKENETADEWIERRAHELVDDRLVTLFVATNDFTEQWVIFGQGALRVPATELLKDWKQAKVAIEQERQTLASDRSNRKTIDIPPDVMARFEEMRRRKSNGEDSH
ncbi:NYN domain-containing protein [Exiguobacterium sp. SH4S7]|uniref:YacP-like NYN domain-containing protein n=1 Tax=unclassified Exiguobacterium TaxID=2644629 RepID=UPI00103EA9E5|nr:MULTISPECIES: NYN domain-containing protein [unclassified Exiguobacterium]TCI24879.1 NYN domain-containing protein [Exiguobacterium sp. SH5S4]TCI33459.1 NYN domain-containing protein [Exiguobacterium sp. SH4S7]TCI51276.1 NYN domain-containing protein [Exiguobacterium sp. SH1S21]